MVQRARRHASPAPSSPTPVQPLTGHGTGGGDDGPY